MPNPEQPLTTPVAIIIFNRPEETARVFAEIAKAKPSKLFVVADGPRPNHPTDAENCAAARAVVAQVDWECEVNHNFAEQNLGCKRRVSSGLEWVFSQVEEAIILEDDILVDPSFFRFMSEMLEYYRDDTRIMHISGSNRFPIERGFPYSYFFTRWPSVWGWATWRRAWKSYDVEMSLWTPEVGRQLAAQNVIPAAALRALEQTYRGKIDTWDFQWTFNLALQSGLSVVPTQNLIYNIGFGANATHTFDPKYAAQQPASGPIAFPLKHPPYITFSESYDAAQNAQHAAGILTRFKRRVGAYRSLLRSSKQ